MEPVLVGLIAGIVGAALGFAIGRSGGRASGVQEGRAAGIHEGRGEADSRFRRMIDAVKRGRAPEGVTPDSAEAELHAALEEGWSPREVERQAALREAIGRVSSFLTTSVRAPLAGAGPDASRAELRERIGQALGALEDLDFFISEVDDARQGTDLSKLAQGVSREFAADQEVGVRLKLGGANIRAEVSPAALMDALYLVLHNAARFGRGATIDLGVEQSGGRAVITVRDRGDGFSEEAFSRAFDPFYSTSEGGLGLGLPHARKVIEGMGGQIELRNVPDGGAEVEISFASN
jgi:signal transduction histidine kinase